MPKIDTKNQTITWDWEDWLAGLHPQYGVAQAINWNGTYAEIGFNPFRFLGYASPGENPTACPNSNLMDGLIKAMIYSPTATHAFACGGSKVLDINPTGGSIAAAMDIANNVFDDIISYYNASDGVEYIFASYNGGATGDIARMLAGTTSTHTDSYWQGTAKGAALDKDHTHPMIVGDDDVLYIGDGNIVRGLDGADTGTNIDVVLTLPAQYVIRGFAKLDNNTLVIVANYGSGSSAQMGIFFWNYLDLDPYKSVYLQGYCGSVFNYKGTVAMVISSLSTDLGTNNRNLSVVAWDGSKFETLAGSQINDIGIPLQRGVEVIGDAIYINTSGTLYVYGSLYSGIKSGLHKIAVGSGGTSGVVKTITSGNQLFATYTTSNFYLQYLYGDYYSSSYIRTILADPQFPMGKKGRLKRVRIEFKATCSAGRTLRISLYDSQGTKYTEVTGSAGIATVTSPDLIKEYSYNLDDGSPPIQFLSLYLLLNWEAGTGSTQAPIVKRVIAEYELINI